MIILKIQPNQQTNFNGSIRFKNMHNHMFRTDYPLIEILRNKIKDEPYNISMSLDANGYMAEVTNNNGHIVKLGPLIIPCHRVIGSNGDLTGFAFGVDVKKSLLEIERQRLSV